MITIGNRDERVVKVNERMNNTFTSVGEIIFMFDEALDQPFLSFAFSDWYIEMNKLELEFGYEFDRYYFDKLKAPRHTLDEVKKILKEEFLEKELDELASQRLLKHIKDLYYPSTPHEKGFWNINVTEDDLIWKQDPEWQKDHEEWVKRREEKKQERLRNQT